MPPRKVLHLIWALDLGGAERQVLEIVRGLDRARFAPTVGCLVRRGRWGEQLEREGARVIDFHKRPLLDPLLPRRIARLMREERFDIVHTHAFTAATWGRLAAVLARVPVIVAHEHSAFSLDKKLCRMVDRALAPVTARWIAVSEVLGRDLIEQEDIPPGRLVVIRNGISLPGAAEEQGLRRRALEVRRELTAGRFTTVLGTLGRLENRKGLEVFLDAMARLAPARPGLGALLVGDGPLRSALAEQVRALGLGQHVVFAGRRDDAAAVLRAFDVFVLPSHTEGLSISLVEAAAAALPIVATAVGGNGEVIEDGTSGLLVPPGDPRVIERAVSRLLDAPGEARALGERAAATARARFAATPMVRAIEALYDELLAARAAAGSAHRFKVAGRTTLPRRLLKRAVVRMTSAAAAPVKPPALRILTYHRVNAVHPGDRLTVHTRAFQAQMETLVESGRPVVLLERALPALQGQASLPPGTVAITFDDGFRDNFDDALPVLDRLGLKATFFLATSYIGTGLPFSRYRGCCDEDGALDWTQAKEMLARGHTLGGHGCTHRELATLPADEVRAEVTGCRTEILERSGHAARLFCYPRGSEDATARRLVAEAGFDAACSVYPGANPSGVDPFLLRRTEISGEDTLEDFRLKLDGVFDAWHHAVQGLHALGR